MSPPSPNPTCLVFDGVGWDVFEGRGMPVLLLRLADRSQKEFKKQPVGKFRAVRRFSCLCFSSRHKYLLINVDAFRISKING